MKELFKGAFPKNTLPIGLPFPKYNTYFIEDGIALVPWQLQHTTHSIFKNVETFSNFFVFWFKEEIKVSLRIIFRYYLFLFIFNFFDMES